MNIKHQITSLELSKKLKDLNVEQLFFNTFNINYPLWSYASKLDETVGLISDINSKGDRGLSVYVNPIAPAYTASELLGMLPESLGNPDNEGLFNLTIEKILESYFIFYYRWALEVEDRYPEIIQEEFYDENLADALGKMLLYLIENNLLQ